MRARHKHFEARKSVNLYWRCSTMYPKSRGGKRESQGSSTIKNTHERKELLLAPGTRVTTHPTQISYPYTLLGSL